MLKLKYISLIFVLFLFSTVFAIKIECIDKFGWTYHNGKLLKDSHLYKSVFEIDIDNRKFVQISLVQINGTYRDPGQYEYIILEKPEDPVLWDKNQIKILRYNNVTGSLISIVFCKGSYIYVDLKDHYLNIFEGKYKYID